MRYSYSSLQKEITLLTLVSFISSVISPFSSTVFAGIPEVSLTYSTNPAKAGEVVISANYSEPLNGSGVSISIDQPGSIDITNEPMTDMGSGTYYSYTYTVHQNDGTNYIDGNGVVSLGDAISQSTWEAANTPSNTIFAIDTTAPAISLTGSEIINLSLGETFVDPGAYWSDAIDGDGFIETSNTGDVVDINTPGTYILGYSYTDAAGNEGVVWGRTVNVTNEATLKMATVAPPIGNYLFGNATQEIGRIGLSASSESLRLQEITFYSSGITNLANIFGSGGSLQLVDVENDMTIPAIATITGQYIIFEGINYVIGAYYTKNLKVVADFGDIQDSIGQNLQILTHSGLIHAVNDSIGTPMSIDDSFFGPYSTRAYTLHLIPPTVTVTAAPNLRQDTYLSKITVKNTDTQTGLALTRMSLQISYSYSGTGIPTEFTGNLCLRDEGSSSTCGQTGTTNGSIVTQTGAILYFSDVQFMNLATAPNYIDRNGQSVTFEVYLDNAPLWIAGDNVTTSVLSVEYTAGGADSSENYDGVISATDTASKNEAGRPVLDTTSPSVTINVSSGQLNPAINTPIFYTALFSEPIDVSSFSKGVISTSGSTASGIVINSITEVAPNDGTTFVVSVTASGTGKVVLSIPEGSTPKSYILTSTGYSPQAITMDSAGNIYTANANSNNVTKITPEGISSILGTTGYSPQAITMDSAGNIYTANANSNNVTKITPEGISSILTSTGYSPQAITMDSAGNIYTANANSNNVTKITPEGISSILTSTGYSPQAITMDSAGNIYTANANSNNVTKITPEGISSILTSTGYSPQAITMDSAGNIYTANAWGNNVTKITPEGISSILGITGYSPRAIAMDSAGNIYTANAWGNNVTKITPHGITDLAGNYNTDSTSTNNEVVIDITQDTVAPVVTVSGESVVSGEVGVEYVDAGASWTDNVDGSGVIPVATSGSVDVNRVGSYLLEYRYVDRAGNVGIGYRTVNILPSVAPVVTVSGESVVSGEVGVEYVDAGASWTDNVDGSGVIPVTTSGSVDVNRVGSYLLEYRYVDRAGNVGIGYRTVNILPSVAPVVTVSGESVVSGEVGVEYVDAGASWTDNVDGFGDILNETFRFIGSVDFTTIGEYILVYLKYDLAGNLGSAIRTVNILPSANVITHTETVSGEITASIQIELDNSNYTPEILVTNNTGFVSGLSNSGLANLPYAQILANNGIIGQQADISGYRLEDTITRAEFAKLVANVGGYTPTDCTADIFADVNSDLGDLCGYIETLAEVGVIPTTNAYYQPFNTDISRGEMIKIILRAVGETPSSISAGYIDVTGLGDIEGYINRANELGYISEGSYAYPLTLSSRGEIYRFVAFVTGLSPALESTSPYTRIFTPSSISGTIYTFDVNKLIGNQTYAYKVLTCLGEVCTMKPTIYDFSTVNTAVPTVYIKPATIAPATTSHVFGNATEEIGRFAIEARNGAVRMQQISFYNSGTANIDSIASSISSIRLYDIATNLQVSATANISGKILTFSGMNDVIGTDMTRNYKVVMDVSSLDAHFGKTIALTVLDINVVRDSDSSILSPIPSDTAMKTYTLGIVPPVVTVTASPSLLQDKYLAKVTVKNTDSNTGLYLTGVTVQFSYRYQGAGTAPTFTGNLCLRDEGSSNACGAAGTTPAVLATQAGLTTTVTRTQLMNLTTAPTLVDKNGQSVTFEVYLDGAPLWTTGDNVSVSVRSLDYTVGGADSNESYVGVTGASATAGVGGVVSEKVTKFEVIATSTGKVNEAMDVTVRAVDKNNNVVPSYTGSIIFVPENFGDTVPMPGKAIVFTAEDNGVKTFSKGVIFKSTGIQKVSVVDVIDDISGEAIVYISEDDSIPPVITLIGSSTGVVEYGASYTDPGANWTDNVDGSGRLLSATSGSVNTGILGNYTLEYKYTDSSGNAGRAYRVITVQDTTAPVITLESSGTITIDAVAYMIRGLITGGAVSVTISGGSGGSITGSLIGNTLNIRVPLVQNSVNTLIITAADASGNRATKTLIIDENSSIDDYISPISISGSTLSGVSIVTGSGITNTTKVTLETPVIFNSGSARTVLPSGTEITNNSGTSFNASTINLIPVVVTGGLLSNEVSIGAIEFGNSQIGLQFSKPIRIEIPVPGYTSTTIEIRVRHGGETTFGTVGLTNNPDSTCSGGIASIPGSIATVNAGIATIYSCAASTFTTVSTPSTITSNQGVSQGGGGPSGGGGSFVYATNSMNFGIIGLQEMLDRTAVGQLIINPLVENITEDTSNISPMKKLLTLLNDGFIKKTLIFQSHRTMKRNEFIKIIALANGYTNDYSSDIHFADVKQGSTAEGYIAYTAEMGWIDTDSFTFRPNEAITLGEAQDILDRITGNVSEGDEYTDWDSSITKEDGAVMIFDQLGL